MGIQVRAGESINAALRANPGAEVQLEAGATFLENVVLSDRGGALVGGAGTQLGSPSVEPAIRGAGPKGWRLADLALLPTQDGMYNVVHVEGAAGITFERLTFRGGPQGQRRVILGNGQDIRVQSCTFLDVWREGDESNAFCATDGAGPYTIIDNDFEVAGINVLFGGAPSSSPESLPSDILVARNRLRKNPLWRGTAKVVKNLLEFKVGRRVRIDENRFEHNWTMAQSGWSIVITPNDDETKAPWHVIEDLTFQRNTLTGCEHGINLLGRDYIGVSQQTRGIRILDNDFGDLWWALQIGNEAGDVECARNRGQVGEFGAVLVYAGDVREPGGVLRPAAYGVETFYYYDNTFSNPRIHGAEFIQQLVEGPAPTPVPPPAEPTLADVYGLLQRLSQHLGLPPA